MKWKAGPMLIHTARLFIPTTENHSAVNVRLTERSKLGGDELRTSTCETLCDGKRRGIRPNPGGPEAQAAWRRCGGVRR